MSKQSEIYEQGYQKWEGDRRQAAPAWWLIAKAGVGNILASSGCFARTLFIIVFAIYYLGIFSHTLVRFQLENLARIDFLAPLLEGLRNIDLDLKEGFWHAGSVLRPSLTFGMFLMFFYGAQLIAKDKAANALQVYFSKAVSRLDYVLGKFAAVGIISAMVSLVPSAIILFFGLLFTTEHLEFLAQSWYLPLAAGLYWLLLTLCFGSVTLFFSAQFDKAYMASFSIVGFMFFSFVFTQIMQAILGAQNIIEGFNLISSIHGVGKAVYELEINAPGLFFWQLCDLTLLCTLMVVGLFRKINPVEVVK